MAVILWSALGLAAEAADDVTVVVRTPVGSNPLLDEAVARTRGELMAAGFRLVVVSSEDLDEEAEISEGLVATIRFELAQGEVSVETVGPDGEGRFEQVLAVAGSDVTAEVIAVRAVEALRATLLDYAQRVRAKNDDLPEVVEGFAQLPNEPPEVVEPPPEPVDDVQMELDAVEPIVVPRAPTAWQALVGIGGGGASFSSTLGWAVQGRAALLLRATSWGVTGLVESTLVRGQRTTEQGRTEVGRDAVLLLVVFRYPFRPDWGLSLQLGGGLASYTLQGFPNAGFEGQQRQHSSPALRSAVSIDGWLSENWAAYVETNLGLTSDAPEVVEAGAVAGVVEQPGIGVVAGFLFGKR